MRKDVFGIVNRFYEERQAFYRKLRHDALEKARCEQPRIADIEREINAIKAATLTGNTDSNTDERYKALVAELKALVMPYMPNIKYHCDKCKDRGYVDGKPCSCFLNRYHAEMKKLSDIGPLPNFTFEDYDIASYDVDNATSKIYDTIYSKMKLFVEKYPDVKSSNIVITGKAGSGKTCLIAAMAHGLIAKGLVVEYVSAFNLSEMMLANYLDYTDNSVRRLSNADVLIIDDLGTEPIRKNINETYLQSILDSRLLSGKSTIVTTNLDSEQLMRKYGERIISRLLDNALSLDVTALPNLRTTKRK